MWRNRIKSVEADAHIGPRRRQARNAIPCGESDDAQRADVGIGPYERYDGHEKMRETKNAKDTKSERI